MYQNNHWQRGYFENKKSLYIEIYCRFEIKTYIYTENLKI
jgi:hypothetical protein